MSNQSSGKQLNRTLPKLSIIQHAFKLQGGQYSIFTQNLITLPQKNIQSRKNKVNTYFLELSIRAKLRKIKQKQSFSQSPEKQIRQAQKQVSRPIKLLAIERDTDRQKFYERMNTILQKASEVPQNKSYMISKKPRHNRFNNRSVELYDNKIIDEGTIQERNNNVASQIHLYPNPQKIIVSESILGKSSKIKKSSKSQYRVYFGPGNNSELVKRVLLSRKAWVQTVEHDSIFNLRWEQTTEKSWYQRICFDKYKQTVNHLENHQLISTKDGLLTSLQTYCNRRSINMFEVVPISFILDWNHPQKLQEQLKKFIFYYCENNPLNKNLKKERQYIDIVRTISDSDVKLSNFSFDKCKNLNMISLSDIYIGDKTKYAWIVKPSQLNRGRGIKICSNLQQLTQILLKSKNQKMLVGSYVIQKYIERPMLINNRKFDIRVWAMQDYIGNYYFFEEGYIRTSCQQYETQDLSNIFVHLTNNAIQSKSEKYGKFESGNQLSYEDFDALEPDFAPFRSVILPKLKEITALTFQSAHKQMFPKWIKNQCGFQIFGLDFMLDYTGKPWLIQVNTNPCIQTSSNLLQYLIPRMLDDAFKIVIDPLYPGSKSQKPYPVPGYNKDQNIWRKMNILKKFGGKQLEK